MNSMKNKKVNLMKLGQVSVLLASLSLPTIISTKKTNASPLGVRFAINRNGIVNTVWRTTKNFTTPPKRNLGPVITQRGLINNGTNVGQVYKAKTTPPFNGPDVRSLIKFFDNK